ncbi:S-adenosylmethionine mitochondrial carrier protein [Blattella germanica]|nr:S-adenosylmethionine mitochondrial carrier protein [Blattella germanica]
MTNYILFNNLLAVMSSEENLPALTSLIAGGFAGITVDVALFPLDTLKTRLQSQRGLFDTGGFGSLYKGVVIAAVGSIPTASLFFFTYNTFKNLLGDKIDSVYHPIMHMTAASAGEVGASLLKVPFDVIKQRQQASKDKLSALAVCKKTIETDGYLGLYRGFGTTVFREVPFVLFSGFIPRTVSFTVGGAVFFGAYQFAVTACSKCGS